MPKYLYLSILAVALLASCKTADLSTEQAQQDTTSKAKAILEAAANAHGADNWSNVQSYEVIFLDEFYGTLGKFASPFKGNPAKLRLEYTPKQPDAKMTFLHEEMKETVWGIKEGATYIQADGKMKDKEDGQVRFWLPTYQYFIEFPGRILEANVFRWLGEEKLKGETHDKILVTWNKVEAQKDFDQYVIWVNSNTQLIGKVAYTIREANNWITGHASLKNIKDFGGNQDPY